MMHLYTALFYYKLERTDFSICLIITYLNTCMHMQFVKMYSLLHPMPMGHRREF